MQRLALIAAALAAPSMSRNASHGPMRHRPVRAGESAPAGGGNTTPTTPAAPPKTDPPADPPRSFSQEELDRIIAREKGKLTRDADALRAKLAEYEARDAEAAEKAKGAEGQAAADARAKRELEKLTKERDAATAATTAAETRYRNSLLDAATSRALVGLEFVGADAAELVEARVRSMLKVEQEGDGAAARDVALAEWRTIRAMSLAPLRRRMRIREIGEFSRRLDVLAEDIGNAVLAEEARRLHLAVQRFDAHQMKAVLDRLAGDAGEIAQEMPEDA